MENELEDAWIEKKLAQDRAAGEIRRVREEGEGLKQRFGVRELEWKNEVVGLEARVEALRSRVEEASTADFQGGSGESTVQLLRQVEMLQSQYEVAKANWETIETSLNARLAVLEGERDASARREGEARKRARAAGGKARLAEEVVEGLRGVEGERDFLKLEVGGLKTRLEQSEVSVAEARGGLERLRGFWDAELVQRVEEERVRWVESSAAALTQRKESPKPSSIRKTSTVNLSALHSSPPPGACHVSRTRRPAHRPTPSIEPSERNLTDLHHPPTRLPKPSPNDPPTKHTLS